MEKIEFTDEEMNYMRYMKKEYKNVYNLPAETAKRLYTLAKEDGIEFDEYFKKYRLNFITWYKRMAVNDEKIRSILKIENNTLSAQTLLQLIHYGNKDILS